MPRKKLYKPNKHLESKYFREVGEGGSTFTTRISEEDERDWLTGYLKYLSEDVVYMGDYPTKLRPATLSVIYTSILERELISADEIDNPGAGIVILEPNSTIYTIIKSIQNRRKLKEIPQYLEFDVSGYVNNCTKLTWFDYNGQPNFKFS